MLSICILNWNCLSVLKETIKLIHEIKELEYEIIVYDQNSNDGSVEFLKKAQSDKLKIILSNKNTGNSISRNQMINIAKYKYIMLLDSDILPIKNSIESMVKFMQEHEEYAFVGYDYESYSKKIDECTNYESEISLKNIENWKNYTKKHIALTQFGIFKKSILKCLPFPEFYPFNQPGWGAEDNILGEMIYKTNSGLGGTISGRTYYHEKSSSINNLGKDLKNRKYIERIIYLFYFLDILNLDQQIESLQKKELSKTKLKCNRYFWRQQKNLGDIATDIAIQKYFPFLQFDENEKTNLLMFGGTIFNHIENANNLYKANFKNILYFGVGFSKDEEIKHGLSIIKKNNIKFDFIPRGYKSKELMLKVINIFKDYLDLKCEEPCGDVLQLFSELPVVCTKSEDPELLVFDIWNENLIKPKSFDYLTIKVADNKSHKEIEYYNFAKFLNLIKNVRKIYSSQIHPIFIGALLGKSCSLYQKDYRADDLKYFSSFKLNMSTEDSLIFRNEAQNNIIKFSSMFFQKIKKFI